MPNTFQVFDNENGQVYDYKDIGRLVMLDTATEVIVIAQIENEIHIWNIYGNVADCLDEIDNYYENHYGDIVRYMEVYKKHI